MAYGSTLRILICIAIKHYSKNSKTADNASFYKRLFYLIFQKLRWKTALIYELICLEV